MVSARILIIEDNPTNMELMVYLLTAFGYTPLMAVDGVSGVQTARETNPDLIICDIHLPKLDGYGVVAALKEDEQLRHVPVLAVTALAMVGDRERLLAAGFDGYIGKPIEPDTFVSELATFLPRVDAHGANGAFDAAGGRRATILIVDDHVLNREFLITLLGYGGHRLIEASNGVEGLKMVHSERPDLVISDMNLPDGSGLDIVRRVRRHTIWREVPVLILSADDTSTRLRQAYALGANSYVLKATQGRSIGEVVKALDDLTLSRGGHAAIFPACRRFATATSDIGSVRRLRTRSAMLPPHAGAIQSVPSDYQFWSERLYECGLQ